MRTAFRAKTIITLAGEAPARTRKALDAPLAALDDGVIVVGQDDRILAVESFAAFRKSPYAGLAVRDLGEVTLAPALVNAHCHLELSHLAGRVGGGAGFVAWLREIVPLASQAASPKRLSESIRTAIKQLADSGVGHVGDVGSRHPGLVAEAAGGVLGVTHFLEVFGYGLPLPAGRLPDALAAGGYCPEAAATLPPERHGACAIAGHALYSTSPEGLRAARAWCRERRRPYSLHLAEFPEEDECLRQGRGALHAMLAERVLPSGWTPPGLGPVACADSLGLLGQGTLAVHCTHCSDEESAILARRGASVCLCPRSNAFIGVGAAPANAMAEAGVLLCLGTDSLASNHDLDMRKELLAAQETWGFSDQALLRMASCNAAHALGLSHMGALVPGNIARFCFW